MLACLSGAFLVCISPSLRRDPHDMSSNLCQTAEIIFVQDALIPNPIDAVSRSGLSGNERIRAKETPSRKRVPFTEATDPNHRHSNNANSESLSFIIDRKPPTEPFCLSRPSKYAAASRWRHQVFGNRVGSPDRQGRCNIIPVPAASRPVMLHGSSGAVIRQNPHYEPNWA